MPRTQRQQQAIVREGERVRDEYAYMDGMPFAGWMWEMIRRTAEYENLLDQCQSEGRGLRGRLNETFIAHWDEQFRAIGLDVVYDDNDYQNTCCTVIGNSRRLHLALPKREKKFNEFGNRPPLIIGTRLVKSINRIGVYRRIFLDDNDELKPGAFDALVNTLSPIATNKTVYVGISMFGNKDIIMEQLKSIVNRYVTKPKKYKRMKQWKYYLIAFDLEKLERDQNDIADILTEAYPDDRRRLVDVRNIGNYLARAHNLIVHGKYKTLILP